MWSSIQVYRFIFFLNCTSNEQLFTILLVNEFQQHRCGYINIFTWNEGQCTIEPFPATSTSASTTPSGGSTVPGSTGGPDVQRTVIFIEQHTVVGQDVFLLGGSADVPGV